MESLGIDIKLFIAQVINFLVVFWALKKFLYRPVMQLLRDRQQKVKETLKAQEEIEKKLDRLEKKQALVLKKARQQAKKEGEKISQKAEEESRLIIEKAQKASRLEYEKSLLLLKEEETAARKRLAKAVTDQMLKQLEAKIMANLKDSGRQKKLFNDIIGK